MVHVVLEEGHIGNQQLICPLRRFKIVGVTEGEVERVPTYDTVWIDLRGIKDDFT